MDRTDQEAALRWAFSEKRLFYRLHALLEMAEDDVTAELVVEAGCACEVLEEYTRRREGLTKLLLGYFEGDEPLHVVVNVQRFESNFEARLEVVTVYRPRTPKWADERTRGMR
ncbi:MAG: DUF4258 domain-containing protein [Actinobacteria bacterium]|nr:DUF4258 domain-containing protein [Actinomycetota bacterium]